MKLVLNNTNFAYNGYKHISPINGDNPLDIDMYVDDNECSIIYCDEIINYVPIASLHGYIAKLASKLQHKGQLTINAVDAIEVNRLYYNGVIDTLTFNNLLYGMKNHPWEFKQSVVHLDEVNEIFKSLNLKILQKKITGYMFLITGERP